MDFCCRWLLSYIFIFYKLSEVTSDLSVLPGYDLGRCDIKQETDHTSTGSGEGVCVDNSYTVLTGGVETEDKPGTNVCYSVSEQQ